MLLHKQPLKLKHRLSNL